MWSMKPRCWAAGTTVSPSATRKAPTSRMTIVSTASSPVPLTCMATTVWSMLAGARVMIPDCHTR